MPRSSYLLPPDQILSGLSVAERKIFFDHRRTLAEFGHDRAGLPRLQLTRHVEDAVAGILDDCNDMGPIHCTQLGRGVYVSMKPVFQQSTSEVAVWVHVLCPSRVDIPDRGERTIRVGFSSELFFDRNPAGRWEYVRTGVTLVY